MQLTDPKGRLHTITLEPGREFHTHRGYLRHDDLIGAPDGSVVTNTAGVEYLALRPAAQRLRHVDAPRRRRRLPQGRRPDRPDGGHLPRGHGRRGGCRFSGALSMSLLRAIGEQGRLLSFERREDFAEIARGNGRAFFGGDHPAWTVTVGDLVEALPRTVEPGPVDRVVLDMLAPWECLDAVADVLIPGGVLICYVATTTQLSRVAEGIRAHGGFTEPNAWESLVGAGTSRASPCGPSTACTATPASSSPPDASPRASSRPSGSGDRQRVPRGATRVRERGHPTASTSPVASSRPSRQRRCPGRPPSTEIPADAWTPEALGRAGEERQDDTAASPLGDRNVRRLVTLGVRVELSRPLVGSC